MKRENKNRVIKNKVVRTMAALLAAAVLGSGSLMAAAAEDTDAVPGQAMEGAVQSASEFKDMIRMYNGERTEAEAAEALPNLTRYEHDLSDNVTWVHFGGCWISIPDYCLEYVEQPEDTLIYYYEENAGNQRAYVMLQALDNPSWTQDKYYELEDDILQANVEALEIDWYVDCGNTTVGSYSAHIARMFRTLEDGTGYELDMCFFFNPLTKQLVFIFQFATLDTEYSYHSTFREIVQESEKDIYATAVAYEKPAVSDADLLARLQQYEEDCTAFAAYVAANGIPAPSDEGYEEYSELKTAFYSAYSNLRANVNADYLSVEDTEYLEALKDYSQKISDCVAAGYVVDLGLFTVDAFLNQE